MRKVTTINQQWGFSKYASEIPECFPKDWKTVNLPHTWNGVDGQDGGNDYYRGKCYYAKEIEIEASAENRSYFLQFDGVNSSAEIYWNGDKIKTHHGGYSAFRVKLQNIKTKNLLVVTADNSPNNYVYPQNADFTFYGGIYRDVKIISVPKNHFDLEFYGAQGIKVTPVMKGNDAQVSVETYLSLEDACEVAISILDANGKEVHKKTAYPEKTVNLKEQESQTFDYCAAAEFEISDAHLWDGVQNPYLYSAKAQLLKNGEVQDEIQVRFGCRSFTFDAEKGFVLNGRPYPLRGVYAYKAWLSKEPVVHICGK